MNNKPLNVLFINHSVRDGGPGRSLFYILKYLDKNRVKPFILIPKDDIFSDNLKKENIYENVIIENKFPENIFRPRLGMEIFNNKTDNLDFSTKLKKFVSAVINIFELIVLILTSSKHIRPNSIDVVYCNGTVAKVVGTFIGLFNSVPVIWHVRNIQQTFILKTIIYSLAKFSIVKRIICVSNATASQFDGVDEKLHVVYNGIDPGEYNPLKTKGTLRKELGIKPSTVIIGSTGRLVPRKGYENLILAVSKFSNISTTDYKVVIVGDTPHFFQYNHLDYLKKRVKDYGLEDKFIFTGYKEDIRPLLKNFDLFVIPSNYPDPFPRSVIEAMCYSLPVIGFKIGGIAEAVDPGVTGYLSTQSDFADFSSSIQTLVEDKDKRIEMGKASRKRVVEMCSASDRSRDIENIICELY